MMEGLTDIQRNLLMYIKENATVSQRVPIDTSEAAKKLGVTIDEVEEALIGLAEKDYIKIVKAPPTPKIRQFLATVFAKLIISYVQGKISQKEYFDRLAELRNISGEIGIPPERFPREPNQISEIFTSLAKNIQALYRLESVSSTMSTDVKEKLQAEYNQAVIEISKTLKQILATIEDSCRSLAKQIDELEAQLKIIEADEKIRGIDKTIEKQHIKTRIEETKKNISLLLSILEPKKVDQQKLLQEAQRIKKLISTLQHQYEIANAKALIEGNPTLKEEARKLETQINQLKQQLATIQSTLSQTNISQTQELTTLISNTVENPPSTITQETLTQLKEINAILQRIKTYQTT
jgi:DNA-binding Lrp family transcriptional regulator